MKHICSTIFCGLLLAPVTAQAELDFGGEAIFGYGEIEGEDGEGYGIVNLTLSNSYTIGAGTEVDWRLRARARTDQDELGYLDDENVDIEINIDFGVAGQLGLSTFNNIDQYPWADAELFNRGSLAVFPVIRKRYDGVADSQFNNAFQKVDPDLLLTYSNRFGPVGFDLIANPLGTWDGFEESEMLDPVATIEGKLTLPTDYGIYSLAYNDLDDAELQVVYPIRSAGVTLIGRYSIDEGDWDDHRANIAVLYRAEDMGVFKGIMLAHADDNSASRTMLNFNFGADNWDLKIAGDTDGDVAVEGSYTIAENSKVLFGWDNGHDVMEGFDDAAFPAPVFAPPRGNAFEIAFVQTF